MPRKRKRIYTAGKKRKKIAKKSAENKLEGKKWSVFFNQKVTVWITCLFLPLRTLIAFSCVNKLCSYVLRDNPQIWLATIYRFDTLNVACSKKGSEFIPVKLKRIAPPNYQLFAQHQGIVKVCVSPLYTVGIHQDNVLCDISSNRPRNLAFHVANAFWISPTKLIYSNNHGQQIFIRDFACGEKQCLASELDDIHIIGVPYCSPNCQNTTNQLLLTTPEGETYLYDIESQKMLWKTSDLYIRHMIGWHGDLLTLRDYQQMATFDTRVAYKNWNSSRLHYDCKHQFHDVQSTLLNSNYTLIGVNSKANVRILQNILSSTLVLPQRKPLYLYCRGNNIMLEQNKASRTVIYKVCPSKQELWPKAEFLNLALDQKKKVLNLTFDGGLYFQYPPLHWTENCKALYLKRNNKKGLFSNAVFG